MSEETEQLATLHPLFVYGTLRAHGSNHWRMSGAQFLSNATVSGSLFRIDWYPGMIIQAQSNLVHGEIYRCDAPLLQQLDEFEGDVEYQRVVTQATMPDGNSINVYAWVYRLPTKKLELIPSGDWLYYISENSSQF